MNTNSTALSDLAISRLRTIVPILWGSLVATLLRIVSPHLPGDVGQGLTDWLGSADAIALVTAAAISGWYWLWRKLEPRIPDWLTRLALGSAVPPAYSSVVAVVTPSGETVAGPASPLPDGTPVTPGLTDAERTDLESLRDILDPGDPGRDALDGVLEQARHLDTEG